jgi:hypothetical protein
VVVHTGVAVQHMHVLVSPQSLKQTKNMKYKINIFGNVVHHILLVGC